MKEIELTQNQIALVSDEDYEYLSQFKWHAQWNKNTHSFYAQRGVRSGLKWTKVRMHRVILSRMLGRELTRQEHIDHINHNTLDNRRENLRLASNAENMRNRRKHGNNTSGVTGVRWHKRDEKWEASIGVNYKLINLGYFDDFDEAAAVRREAEQRYFGEFRYSLDNDAPPVTKSL